MSKDVNVGKKTDVTYLRRLRPNDVTLTFVGFLYAPWWVFLSKLHQLLDTLIIRRCIICTTIMQQFLSSHARIRVGDIRFLGGKGADLFNEAWIVLPQKTNSIMILKRFVNWLTQEETIIVYNNEISIHNYKLYLFRLVLVLHRLTKQTIYTLYTLYTLYFIFYIGFSTLMCPCEVVLLSTALGPAYSGGDIGRMLIQILQAWAFIKLSRLNVW